MTRKEQIKEAARQRANQYDHPVQWNDTYHGFISGAEWADEYPIHYDGKAMLHVLNKGHEQGWKEAVEKACKWIEENFQFDEAGYCSTNFYSKDSMLHSFKIDTKED